MFGTGYVKDERIKVAMDEAGNHTYVFTLILLWGTLVWSLITKNTAVMFPTFIIFMLANIFYLVNLVRKGALQYRIEGKKRTDRLSKKNHSANLRRRRIRNAERVIQKIQRSCGV